MIISLTIGMIVLGVVNFATAQTMPLSKPSELGLRLPVGREVFEVTDSRVLVAEDDDTSEPVVARVYLEVGSHYVLLMPDGSLRSVEKRLTTETDRPFEPISKKELSQRLKRQFPRFKIRETRHYLFVYNTDEGFCERRSKILETMYPRLFSYFRRQKLDPVEPELPLVVVMFATKKQFQAYSKMPESMLAYYNGVNNRVYMYQSSDLNVAAPLLAVKQSVSTAAHEGVHQILHNIGVQKRLSAWPLWISEGLAEYFAPTSSGLRSKWKGVGRPNELRMRELFLYLNQHPRKRNGALIEEAVITKRFASAQYAVSWSLVHFLLTKRKDDFFRYLRDVSGDLPLEQQEDELKRFEEYFGYNLAKLEREMLAHIRSLPYIDPIENQPYFLFRLAVGKKKEARVTSARDFGRIRREMLDRLPPQDRSRTVFLEVLKFQNRRSAMVAMALYLGKK